MFLICNNLDIEDVIPSEYRRTPYAFWISAACIVFFGFFYVISHQSETLFETSKTKRCVGIFTCILISITPIIVLRTKSKILQVILIFSIGAGVTMISEFIVIPLISKRANETMVDKLLNLEEKKKNNENIDKKATLEQFHRSHRLENLSIFLTIMNLVYFAIWPFIKNLPLLNTFSVISLVFLLMVFTARFADYNIRKDLPDL